MIAHASSPHTGTPSSSRVTCRPRRPPRKWERAWGVLFGALAELTDDDLAAPVTIRGVPFRVDEALLRSLAHLAYHVGQIVLLARSFRGDEWAYLSIPPGQSEVYNENPVLEKSSTYTESVARLPRDRRG